MSRLRPPTPDDPGEAGGDEPALAVLRRALGVTPELRRGLVFTVVLAGATAVGRVSIPILLQQVIDRGIVGGFRPAFVAAAAAAAAVVIGVVYLTGRTALRRLTSAAERTLYALRVRVFDHIHRLSIASHAESRRGIWLARVTSDIEVIERFLEWGGVAWIVDIVLIVVVVAVMAVFSWQLAVIAVVILALMVPVLRAIQRRQLRAYDGVRLAVGRTLGSASESLMGATTIRAYGIEERSVARLDDAIANQYRSYLRAARLTAINFSVGDLFGAFTLAIVAGVGAWLGPGWGLDVGELVALLFLVTLLQSPVNELGEILDQTQVAIAGWRKVLSVLELPVEVVEPDEGAVLPLGALAVSVHHLRFAYGDGPDVLDDVSIDIPEGAHVAVVGETGSGKTTFAKLLVRLADPASGRITVGGSDLRTIDPDSRRRAIRLVPQDGFLFDASVSDNVTMGRPGATTADAARAFDQLGLSGWVARLPKGLASPVGERGEQLSVGERQLVALARAQLADPGLLVLDEATSAVDPETEQALTEALARLAQGRTTVAIAHRLSTAEQADVVLVFDRGRLVEVSDHATLVAAGGTYARLHASWVGNTRSTPADPAGLGSRR